MAIIKNAKNINIVVKDNYTSISKVSYEESEEVIVEALKENLEFSSQKKVVKQGFGKESEKEEDKKLEESKLLEIKNEQDTFVPFGIPDFRNNKENDKIKFKVIVKEGTFEKLSFKIKNECTEIYSEEIDKSLKKGDIHPIEWNGFSNDKIYDSTWFINDKLIAEVTDGTTTSQVKINGEHNNKKVKWVDVQIDDNSRKIDVTLRINLKEGKVGKNVVKTFNDLVLLAQEGLIKYWGRNKTRTIGNSIKINENEYEIFINSVNTEINSMPELNVYASTTDYGRSRNWWASRKLFYNDGEMYSLFDKYSRDPKFVGRIFPISKTEGQILDEKEYIHTSAHEIGHEILQVFGGQNNYSYVHKDTSTLLSQKTKDDSSIPSGEKDLMKYYIEDNFVYRKESNFYNESIADEKDVLGLIWCSKLKIK